MIGPKAKFVAKVRIPGGRPKFGFTLIELLVVMTVVGILTGLLLPALGKSKAAALSVECKGNLRDFGFAIRMYVDDYEHYPESNGTAIVGYDSFGMLVMSEWKETLLPYVGLVVGDGIFLHQPATMRKLRCPQRLPEASDSRGRGQYGLNAYGTATLKSGSNLGIGGHLEGKQLRPTAEAQVIAPADMIAVGDAPAEISSSVFDICSSNRARWPGTSHGGQANMLLCDGHVESARQTNWISSSDAIRRRWNNDNKPHPETWKRP